MRRPTWAALGLLLAAGCGGYWRAHPAGNTAPTSWADGATASAPTATAPPDGTTLEERLRNLDRLRSDGLIGQAEYRERRQQALDAAFD